jgi:hypothetical protein
MKNSTYRLSLFQYVKFYYAIQHFCSCSGFIILIEKLNFYFIPNILNWHKFGHKFDFEYVIKTSDYTP